MRFGDSGTIAGKLLKYWQYQRGQCSLVLGIEQEGSDVDGERRKHEGNVPCRLIDVTEFWSCLTCIVYYYILLH